MNRAALQKQLGRKIRAMRQGRGLSAEAFAEMCRITPIKLWDIEHGHVNPALSTLVRISRQLNVTLAGLLRRIH
jgi:transcriptional regulator with XRE-family HTH domain